MSLWTQQCVGGQLGVEGCGCRVGGDGRGQRVTEGDHTDRPVQGTEGTAVKDGRCSEGGRGSGHLVADQCGGGRSVGSVQEQAAKA